MHIHVEKIVPYENRWRWAQLHHLAKCLVPTGEMGAPNPYGALIWPGPVGCC